MRFGDLTVGQEFRYPDSELVWTKKESGNAYGFIKAQNAYAQHKSGVGPIHYDHVSDDTEIILVVQ